MWHALACACMRCYLHAWARRRVTDPRHAHAHARGRGHGRHGRGHGRACAPQYVPHAAHACIQVLRGEATSSLRLDHPDAVMMRSSAYVTVAKLCQRVPEIVQADLNLPSQLFAWLETEPLAARTSLQEALAALAEVHARKPGAPPPPPSMTSALRVLLLKVSSSLTFPSLACPSPSHAPLSRCPSLSPVCECHVPVRVVASSVPSACECACIAHGRVLAA